MRLDARIEKLERAQGSAQNRGGYDQRGDYRDHIWYMLCEDGLTLCVASFYDGHGQYGFACERDLWAVYPAGTKFLRSAGEQDHEVIDGQMRELRFPPPAEKLAPELQAVVDSVMGKTD